MTQDSVGSRLSRILEKLCQEKEFLGALVCTEEGLIVSSYARKKIVGLMEDEQEGFDQVVGALGSLFLSVASRARQELRLKHVEELYLRGNSEFGWIRVVFRVFETITYGKLVLSVLMGHTVPYRRVTSNVIRMIKEAIDR